MFDRPATGARAPLTAHLPIALAAVSLSVLGIFASSAALADKISHPVAVFAGLDKITGRIISFQVNENETVQFGTLQITPRVCFTRPPTEAPQTDGFVQVDEVTGPNVSHQIFSGWMFAASPGLNGVEHPIYDVWLTDCLGGTQIIASAPETTDQTTDPAAFLPVQPPPPRPGTVPRPRIPRQVGGGQIGTQIGGQPQAGGQLGGLPASSLPPLGAPIDVGTAAGAPAVDNGRQRLVPPGSIGRVAPSQRIVTQPLPDPPVYLNN